MGMGMEMGMEMEARLEKGTVAEMGMGTAMEKKVILAGIARLALLGTTFR